MQTDIQPNLTSGTKLHEFSKKEVWNGFTQLVPLSFFVVVFGAAFGLAASQTGLDNTSSLLMSTLVFAGASQFAALDLWGTEVPVIPLMVTVFAINARHLLMGATLYPWLRHLPPAKRYGVMLLASDANWALSLNALSRGERGIGLLLGGGLALWSFWIVGTWLGLTFGNAIHDPVSLGLDMVMGCFLLSMVAIGPKNIRILVIWAVAAGSSLLAYWYLPENSHVVVGALSGGLLGAFWTEKKHDH
ncbi:AzlC family ABC transporter permease [Photobacterium ganghwense]|uniref:AzlC family ABC transporter permease n=1 Tax=Photobacterium ganghwense TaxID=320778 RepID=UPI001C2D2EDF|nr:AzlC family ABC transporter permease [Photobacterium ganghwense]MBV1842105.1 AzlC family ABC transporter permease [Photobacterium ganghwense]